MPDIIIPLLYALCFILCGGLVLFIAYFGWRLPTQPPARLRRTFFWLVLSLLVWQVTYLSAAAISLPPGWLLPLGRANFAAIAFTVYLAFCFIREVAGCTSGGLLLRICGAETISLALLTLFTPWIDAAEYLAAGRPVSDYGPLFPVYLLHSVSYLAAVLVCIWRAQRERSSPAMRQQLHLIGLGICLTGSVALVCNAVLPYVFADFRFCDAGPLATLFFILAIAYAVFVHGLFDLRVVIRKTLVYGVLLTFVLGGYSSVAFLITEHLTKGADRLTQFAVLLIAFSLDPLRRWLEKKIDRLLFRQSHDD